MTFCVKDQWRGGDGENVHVAPLMQSSAAWFEPSLFPSAENCALPVPAEQPEVHVSATQLVPPSVDASTDPAQASVVGLVTFTATIAE